MGRKRKRKAKAKAKSKAKTERMLNVTYPNGRTARVPDDGRSFPTGTMVEWDEVQPSGREEMRWTVVGGGWPFDD